MKTKLHILNLYLWAARVIPIIGIVGAVLLYFFDLTTIQDYFYFGLVIITVTMGATWWWWLMFALRKLYQQLSLTHEKFDQIAQEISQTRKDLEELKQPKR